MSKSKYHAEELQAEMARIRDELRDDVREVVAGARGLLDWRQLVSGRPWIAFGAAAVAGFLAVPNRVQIVSPDPESLAKLAKKNQLVVKPGAKPEKTTGMLGPLVNLALATVARQAVNVMSQQIGHRMSAHYTNGNSRAAAQQSASQSVTATGSIADGGDERPAGSTGF